MIITKVENNRITKYIPYGELNEELLKRFPDAFFYDGEYNPCLWVENQTITEVALPVEVKTNMQLLSETDQWMSRISEDTVVALIAKGIAQKSDYAPIVLERINYRRSLRGQVAI